MNGSFLSVQDRNIDKIADTKAKITERLGNSKLLIRRDDTHADSAPA